MNLDDFKNKYKSRDIFDVLALENKDKHMLMEFVNSFTGENLPKLRGMLLVGPPGVGKTETAYTLARQFDMEVLEVNASDTRNEETLKEILEYSLTCEEVDKPTIVLLDEIDGLVKRADDSGGVRYIGEVLKNTKIPIILTANDDTKIKRDFKSILAKVTKIIYKPIQPIFLRKFIKEVSVAESLHLSDTDIMKISQLSQGDMRKVFGLMFLPEGIRLEKMINDNNTIFTFLNSIYGMESPEECLEIYYNSDITRLSNAYIWICESFPAYNSSSLFLEKAYAVMAKYGVLVHRSETLNNWYLQKFVLKAMIYDLKGLIGQGNDRHRKYPTPYEFGLSAKLKELRKVRNNLKLCFYDADMSLSAFESNFWAIRKIYAVDRKFVIDISIKVYRYSLLVEDDVKFQKELFCKMMSVLHSNDTRAADEFIEAFETLDDDDSHRFAVAVSKKYPDKIKERKREVKKRIKEESEPKTGVDTDLDSLTDIDLSDLV